MKAPISTVNSEVFDIPYNTFEVYAPDHITYTLRERNGEDEGILSRMDDFNKGLHIPKFLANIIVGPRRYSVSEIQAWPVKVKYYLMFKERRHEYGDEVTWVQKFEDHNKKEFSIELTEYLEQFDGNISDPTYKPSKEGQITAYPKDFTNMSGILASGIPYRMKYITGEMESNLLLEKKLEDLTINDRFLVRELEIQDKNAKWIKIERLNMLSGKDTRELRKILETEDVEFTLMSKITNPKTGATDTVSLFQILDFFFQ